jgi:hypothetical protein
MDMAAVRVFCAVSLRGGSAPVGSVVCNCVFLRRIYLRNLVRVSVGFSHDQFLAPYA